MICIVRLFVSALLFALASGSHAGPSLIWSGGNYQFIEDDEALFSEPGGSSGLLGKNPHPSLNTNSVVRLVPHGAWLVGRKLATCYAMFDHSIAVVVVCETRDGAELSGVTWARKGMKQEELACVRGCAVSVPKTLKEHFQ